ncbi:MAG: phosphate acetyltransferase [Turicibacter sp.]|nr:phosphate acetyltransferase [Turicibacter sp.]
MDIMTELRNNILGKGIRIVLPEGNDERVVSAASVLGRSNMVKPIVLGNKEEVLATVKKAGDFSMEGCEIIDPETYEGIEEMIAAFVAVRKGKIDEEGARKLVKDVNYFGTMLVHMGLADGLVSGAVHSTGDTIRPALQIIKTKPGVTKTFGYFAMLKEAKRRYIFADCAVNPDPSSSDLAEFAIGSAEAARMFNIDPKVALLSFSTHGSAKTPATEKVAEAVNILDGMDNLNFDYDGELQFDAALVEGVGKLKAPDSKVAGQANVFVFPDLNAGNIGYKIAQRLGGYEAVGPILAGLNKPVNDLSRGCTADDVYNTVVITANQALGAK